MTTEITKEELKENVDKIYKTPDYVRRAKRNYARKRYQEDPEYREKKNKLSYESKKKHIEKTREYKRNYMREYRAKKKADKSSTPGNSSSTTSEITDSINTLSITS